MLMFRFHTTTQPRRRRLASSRAAASWAGESLIACSGATPTGWGHPVACT